MEQKTQIQIKDIRKQDYKKAIQFAIKGMHFDWYLDSKFLLNAYGRYFWYLEMNRATHIFATYVDDKFVGVLLAEIYGEEKKHRVWTERLYVKFADFIQRIFFKSGAGLYDDTVKSQLAHYLQNNKPDGEIIFLAADPDAKIKGVGSALLNALEEKNQRKDALSSYGRCLYLSVLRTPRFSACGGTGHCS